MALKTCDICGNEFDSKGNAKTCDSCKVQKCPVCGADVALTEYAKSKLKTDGFVCCCRAHTAVMRGKPERDKSKPYRSLMRRCELCGDEFEGGTNSRYCEKCKVQSCIICGEPVSLSGSRMSKFVERGFATCGSAKCRLELTRRRLLSSEGISNVAQRPDAREKLRNLRLNDSDETKVKRSESLRRSCSSNEVREKTVATNMKRYGVASVLELPEVYMKGVEAARADDSKERRVSSNKSRYGVPNTFLLPGVNERAVASTTSKASAEKRRATMMERYGVEHPWANHTERMISGYMESHPNAGISEVAEALGVGYWAVEIQNRMKGLGVKTRVSYLERIVATMLDGMGVSYVRRDRSVIAPKELDFFIPDARLAIEVNDIASHNSTVNMFNPGVPAKGPSYHADKYFAAKSAGVSLMSVWEWQLVDQAKRDIVFSMLASKLGFIEERVHARKCSVVDVAPCDAKNFVNANHLQGWCASSESKGLVFDGELVSVMCFNGGELTRFCSKVRCVVVGGFSKLLSAFDKSCVFTFSFNDYSDGGLYERNGFSVDGEVPPRYWWVKRGNSGEISVLSRRSCQKREISRRFGKEYYDYEDAKDTRSESELMEGLGYVRVFDCGKVKWIL